MLTTNLQQSPYLPRQRNFPNDDVQELGVVLDKTYIEIASKVNERTIGLYAVNFPIITGENWFLSGQPKKLQTLRQVYAFGEILPGGTFSTPISLKGFSQFTRIYGTIITDEGGGNRAYKPLPTASTGPNQNVDIVVVNGTTLLIRSDAGQNRIISGLAILEWLSNSATNT